MVDRKGQPVRGLTKDDFAVTENGVPQAVTSFEAVVVPPAAPRRRGRVPAARGSRRTSRPTRSGAGRSWSSSTTSTSRPCRRSARAGAVVAFLESGVGAGDVVTLVATGGGAWWTARMPRGARSRSIDILKRLDGRYVPDPSPDRITEYEAMRIEEYQDEQMAWQVKRRFDSYGAVGQEKDSRGVRPADAVSSTPGMIPEVVRMRAREVYEHRRGRATRSRSPSMAARDRVPRRHQGPQGHDPRLAGLRLRHRSSRR